jgi:hypothetical protein
MGAAKEKVRQVFQFLAELQTIRTPPARRADSYEWSLPLTRLPQDPSIDVGSLPPSRPRPTGAAPPEDLFILRVRRPKETPCPPLPSLLRDWVRPGWQAIDGNAQKVETRNRSVDGATVTERFEDDASRVAAWHAWLKKREAWVVAEQPVRSTMRVFQKLFELRGRLEREAERFQLVLGDGFLKTQDALGYIDHPLLLQKVELQFDPNVPEFRIVETDDPCELNIALLAAVPSADGAHLGQCRTELTKGEYHPLGHEDTDGFLSRVIQSIFADGRLVPSEEAAGPVDTPVVYRNPLLYLAPRSAGFSTAIEGVLRQLQESDSDEDVSPVLSRVVGIDPGKIRPNAPDSDPPEAVHQAPGTNPDVDLLLTKPANSEQERVIRRLATTGSVLVQGPPGTGKTHTIANLVGHLLAQGKSILITSHTAKALRVVRKNIAEELRPLCVSVLDTDLSNRKELEEAVAGIVGRLSTSDAEQLEHKAEQLRTERQTLQTRITEVRRDLDRAVKDEYDAIVVGGTGVSPSGAARRVRDGAGRDDWIPGPVRRAESLPLSPNDVTELYRLTELLPAQDEHDLAGRLPELGSLPLPAQFVALVGRLRSLRSADLQVDECLWPVEDIPSRHDLKDLCRQLLAALQVFTRPEPWFRECVEAGFCGGVQHELWDEFTALIEETHGKAALWHTCLTRSAVEVVLDKPPERQHEACLEIIQHIRSGGGLGALRLIGKPRWKRLLASVTVDGGAPRSLGDFEAVDAWFSIRETRNRLLRRWERQIGHLKVPTGDALGDRPEQICHQYIPQLRAGLVWHQNTWAPCLERLRRLGVRWEQVQARIPPVAGPWPYTRRVELAVREYVLPMAQRLRSRLEIDKLTRTRDAVVRTLAAFGPDDDPGQVVHRLREAAAALDTEAYSRTWGRLEELQRQRKHYVRRCELLARLEQAAPAWAHGIRQRAVPHDGPLPPGEATPVASA